MWVGVQGIRGVKQKHITPDFGVLSTDSGKFLKEWLNLSTGDTYCAKNGTIYRGEVSHERKNFGPFHSVPKGLRVCIGDSLLCRGGHHNKTQHHFGEENLKWAMDRERKEAPFLFH